MKLEAKPDGLLITVDRPNPYKEGTLTTEELAITLAEAESLLRGLPGAIEQAREKDAIRQAHRRQALRAELERLEER